MDKKPQQNMGQKLVAKPQAVLALAIIAFTIMIALLAYFLAPDASPNANRMIVELGAKKPGFTKLLLPVPGKE